MGARVLLGRGWRDERPRARAATRETILAAVILAGWGRIDVMKVRRQINSW